MSFEVVRTEAFEKQFKKLAKKHKSLPADLLALVNSLQEHLQQGDNLGKDCYKVRLAIASKGKGKSGGARVITCVKIVKGVVYLLAIYDKSERETISDAELKQLVGLLGG